jgi:hypothetical protein
MLKSEPVRLLLRVGTVPSTHSLEKVKMLNEACCSPVEFTLKNFFHDFSGRIRKDHSGSTTLLSADKL